MGQSLQCNAMGQSRARLKRGFRFDAREVGSRELSWSPVDDVIPESRTNPKLTRCRLSRRIVAAVSGFEENLDNAVNHFKLLRVALGEERINPLADVSWVFFPFQE